MSEYAILAKDITKRYVNGEAGTEVLKGVSVQISPGEFCAIMGQSGSGKSTLLHILGTLDEPTGGTLEIMGRKTEGLPDRQKALLRRKTIGFIFQSFYLIPGISIYENVMMPNLMDRRKADHAYLQYLLETVGLMHRKAHLPSQLSGGEQQRGAIARALANRPPLLLADEPTGNLDSKNSLQIIELLHKINCENKVTIVMVTHSAELASECGRIITVKDGIIT